MADNSYLNRWALWYKKNSHLAPYGDTSTYNVGVDFLRGLAVEDWGCGLGWYKTVHEGPYVGIDGTPSEHANIVADLREYTSNTPAVWMRHVLEHNPDWRDILKNALGSAQEKIVIIVFTPNGNNEQIDYVKELEVPDIALPHKEIADEIRKNGFKLVDQYTISTGSFYKEETVFLASKNK